MTRGRVGPTRTEIGATLGVLALAVLAIIALWPSGGSGTDGPGGPGTGGGPQASQPAAPGAAPGEPSGDPAAADPDALAAARAAAGPVPCPAPSPSGAAARGPLAGVVVPCLGTDGRADVGAALAGRPALVNVWASWCVPCRDELPVLAEYAAAPGAVPVLTVDVRDDPVSALRMLGELRVGLPAVTDPGGAVRAALDVPPALPASYVVRADGTAARVDPPVPFRTPGEVAAAVERLS